jgi:peptidoglycan/xylan/chitin deacetylase (PgdA/CDA1 family)
MTEIGLVVTGVVAVLAGLYLYAWSVPTWQVFGPALVHGPARAPQVALTFDDGPSFPYTGQILDILRDRRVPATFFLCGKNVERYPEIARRIVTEGHAIGNHTYSHPFPYFRRRSFFAAEVDRAQDAIERATGQRPKIFRPPFGARWLGMYAVLRERSLPLINWSDTGYDWKRGADIVGETLKHLRAGSIILLHDGKRVHAGPPVDQSRTVSALPAIIDGARRASLTFVSVIDFLPSQSQSTVKS